MTKRSVTIRLSEHTIEALRRLALAETRSIGQTIEVLVKRAAAEAFGVQRPLARPVEQRVVAAPDWSSGGTDV